MLTLSLYVVGILFFVIVAANSVLKNVEEKINVSVYFKSDVAEERIMEIKKDLEKYAEIYSIDYVSKDQALDDFKRNNADEPVIIRSLEEIGENPLLASLIIKANRQDQYQAISDFVANSSFNDDVSRINYSKNKEIIAKLNNIIREVKKVGSSLAVIFGAVSVLIIFNTIRITIYTHKQEIEVMRLVGASNMFIRLPFVFEGLIYGLIAMIIATGMLFVNIKFMAYYFPSLIPSQDLVSLYFNNLPVLFAIQAGAGMFLGIISSWIAIRKYLKI